MSKPRFSGDTFVDQASDYLNLLQSYLDGLLPTLEALMIDIINNADVTEAVLNRRTQSFMKDLSDWHQAELEIQNLTAYGVDREGLSLLTSVYRHYLDAVEDWLRRLIESIDNPGIMLQRQGISTNKQADAPLVLNVCLHLTQAPDLPQLHRWLIQRNDQLMTASMKKINRSTGVLAVLLGLMWLN